MIGIRFSAEIAWRALRKSSAFCLNDVTRGGRIRGSSVARIPSGRADCSPIVFHQLKFRLDAVKHLQQQGALKTAPQIIRPTKIVQVAVLRHDVIAAP
jgi:hypothetical protein